MRSTKTNKGITLIALIITIVVLLILAVVAINSIQNEDIIAHVSNSAGTYNNSVTNEQSILAEYEEFLKQHSCAEHNFENGVCSKCGAENLCKHETTKITYKMISEESCEYTNSCVTCGYVLEYNGTSHNYVNGKCTQCLESCGHSCCGLYDIESYEYGDEYSCVAVGTCNDCGLEGVTYNYEHDWSYGEWTANGMEGCSATRTCSQCNHSETVQESHTWNMDVCSKCEKQCEHSWNYDEDTGYQWCSICGCN